LKQRGASSRGLGYTIGRVPLREEHWNEIEQPASSEQFYNYSQKEF
jgi:hypothetical protein